MAGCSCAALAPELEYWSSLFSYITNVPILIFTRVVRTQQLLTHGALAGAQSIQQCAFSISGFLVRVLVSIVGLITTHAASGVLGVTVVIAWQVYYPLRVTLRLLARLPCFRGVAYEFPPLKSSNIRGKHVVLTLNCGPSPNSTDAILTLLGQHNAHATFFITGSQVDKCDAVGAGSGHEDLGKTILGRILAQGHQLGVQGWQNCSTHTLGPNQLTKELTSCSKLLTTAQKYSVLLATTDTSSDSTTSAAPPQTPKRHKWFRPQGGLPSPCVVETAEKLGYCTVLASVFPWDNYSGWPLLNACYVWSKVYPGAVVMLNEGRHLLPTLKLVLPWLKDSSYQIVTLDTAAAACSPLQGALTTDALAQHNKAHPIGKSSSYGMVDVMARAASSGSLTRGLSGPGSATSSTEKSPASPQGVSATSLNEESERQRLKAVKRAEADKRAGIDRQLASMSAAEKRAAERKERERKEADKRRARRAAEALKAQQRYAESVRRKAEQHRLMEPERVAAVDAWRQQTHHQVIGSDEIQPA